MVAPPHASSNPSTAWFSSNLTEMDAQLAAVQRIADSLEQDFSNTKMVPNNDECRKGTFFRYNICHFLCVLLPVVGEVY